MKVGVLALQGDYARHADRLRDLNVPTLEVRLKSELDAVDGLIIPGGESTAILRLMKEEMRQGLCEFVSQGKPILATCAGVILLAKRVMNPSQESLELLDVTVERNSYGRQINSFISGELSWTESGKQQLAAYRNGSSADPSPVEGVFIRAPRITEVGDETEVFLTYENDPVLVKQQNILAATFHPELSDGACSVTQLFLNQF